MLKLFCYILEKKVITADDVINILYSMKLAFYQLILTLPVFSASAGCCFSTMNRVKTYFHSTMSNKKLNNLCVLSI